VSDPFSAYGDTAVKKVTAPQKLLGPIKARAGMRARYVEIVSELNACDDDETLHCFLTSISQDIAQFKAEHELFWKGDGEEFPGLQQEIETTQQRCRNAERGFPLI
jgi:hypothetical protein